MHLCDLVSNPRISFFAQVCTVRDKYSLENYNASYINYEYRVNTTNPFTNETYFSTDTVMNSEWRAFSLAAKGMAFIPALLAFVCFGLLISYFGRWKPTSKDPHGGRLKKRKKGRFSRIWQRLSRRGRSSRHQNSSAAGGGGNSSEAGQDSKEMDVVAVSEKGDGKEDQPAKKEDGATVDTSI